MSKKKKIRMLAFAMGMMMLTSGSGLIYAQATASVENTFEFGVVDIDLTEYQTNGKKETLYPKTTVENILPGQKISKIPRIHNDGADCYVRVKLSFKNMEDLDTDDLDIGKDWVEADDGYWYYKNILEHDEDVDIFTTLTIPSDFDQEENEEKKFDLVIDVDAIQAKNFEPNFKQAKPWGNVEIIAYEEDGDYDYSRFRTEDDNAFTVTYQGTDKLVANEDDFFANIPFLMPGDSYTDELSLSNTSKTPVNLYFSTSYDRSEKDLLEKIDLTITKTVDGKTTTVYEGDLAAAKLQEKVLIGEFDAGDKGSMEFTITVPEELTNEYALANSNVTWTFTAEPIEEEDDTPGFKWPDFNWPDITITTPPATTQPGQSTTPSTQTPSGGQTSTQTPSGQTSTPSAPQTGDLGYVQTLKTVFAASTAGLIMTLIAGIVEKKKEDEA